MITAILACVHGNLTALTAVLGHARAQGATRFVSLGDAIGYGPSPRECLALLAACEVSLLGDHEEALLAGEAAVPSSPARAVHEWTRERLRLAVHAPEEDRALFDRLARMPSVVEEGAVTFVHGSPRIPTRDYVVPSDALDREKMQAVFAPLRRVGFVGHSHIPHLYLSDGTHRSPEASDGVLHLSSLGTTKALVNVGSVGQPRDGDPRTSYVTFDGETVRWHRLAVAGMDRGPWFRPGGGRPRPPSG